jgi:hypothetical protein
MSGYSCDVCRHYNGYHDRFCVVALVQHMAEASPSFASVVEAQRNAYVAYYDDLAALKPTGSGSK